MRQHQVLGDGRPDRKPVRAVHERLTAGRGGPHSVAMDPQMRRRIDAVLDRVKDPESGLPLARIGVVERVRYNADRRELYVFTDFLSHQPGCPACVGIASVVIDGIRRRLLEELRVEFPTLTSVLV
jgi:metal-sulfur cluster biosynthetic enzyme